MMRGVPRIIQVTVCRRADRAGWWIVWRDRQHRACGPECRVSNSAGLHRVYAGMKRHEAERMAAWVRDRLHPWNASQLGIPWDEFVALYMLSIATMSGAHRRIAERVLTRFTSMVRPARSVSVTPAMVDQYLAELQSEAWEHGEENGRAVRRKVLRAATNTERAKHWRYLHALFEFGIQRKFCYENPVVATNRPRVEESLIRAPRWPQVVDLLAAVPRIRCNDSQGLYLFILLAVVTGLRETDLLALRVSDFEPSSSELPVALWWGRNRKGKKVKCAGIPPLVERLILERLAALPEGEERFFVWPSFPHNAWRRLRLAAKAGDLRFQALRRAAGALAATSRVRAAGAAQLQHSSDQVYRRHYEDRELEAVAVAQSLLLPVLPEMPAYVLGVLDRRGRRRVVQQQGGQSVFPADHP